MDAAGPKLYQNVFQPEHHFHPEEHFNQDNIEEDPNPTTHLFYEMM